jgi:hypothetical protein
MLSTAAEGTDPGGTRLTPAVTESGRMVSRAFVPVKVAIVAT